MGRNRWREVYEMYAAGVAYVEVKTPSGAHSIGTAFHIGQGVFISARHVFEGNEILEIATTETSIRFLDVDESEQVARFDITHFPGQGEIVKGPFYHPDPKIDVAAVIVEGINAPVIPLGDHLDDWLGTELVLREVVVLGYPPIPFSWKPNLIASKAEVNAIIDKYTGGHPHFILSAMARGGFSGGPAITDYGCTLGVVTESLLVNHQPLELGYMSVLSVEPIYVCLSHHNIVPDHIDKQWEGFWKTISSNYTDKNAPLGFQHVSVSFYQGHMGKNIEIFCYDSAILQKAINLITSDIKPDEVRIEKIHDKMVKIWFLSIGVSESFVTRRYDAVKKLFEDSGFERFPKTSNDDDAA